MKNYYLISVFAFIGFCIAAAVVNSLWPQMFAGRRLIYFKVAAAIVMFNFVLAILLALLGVGFRNNINKDPI